MKIRDEELLIGHAPVNEEGDKVEPEGQPLQRIIHTDGAQVSMQRGEAPVGAIPMDIVYDTTVGEFANAIRRQCWTCKHFDQEAWKKLYHAWNTSDAPIEQRTMLNNIRAAMLETNNMDLKEKSVGTDGDFDVEHALSFLGICHPMTEIANEPVIVHSNGGCPDEVLSPSQPHGFYESRDNDSERAGANTFDNIMRLAQGRGKGSLK